MLPNLLLFAFGLVTTSAKLSSAATPVSAKLASAATPVSAKLASAATPISAKPFVQERFVADETPIPLSQIQPGMKYWIAIEKAVAAINEDSAYSTKRQELLQVISAKREAGAGTLYTFVIQLVDTNCLKSMDYDEAYQPCVVQPPFGTDNPSLNTCLVKVAEQGWQLPKFQVTNVDCNRPVYFEEYENN